MAVSGRKRWKVLNDERATSPLLEYLMLVTIASVFVLLLGLYLNSVFADGVKKTVLENQLADVAAEISAQMVDMYLLYPSNGTFTAKIYMPEKVGDYEIVSSFESVGGQSYLVVQSEKGEFKKYVGLGNLPLDFSLNGSTHSMEEMQNVTYSTENYLYPTAILLAGPTVIRSGMDVEFDPRFSKTNDGYFEYQIDFGDGNVSSRLVYDDANSSILHTYYASVETYYTATLRVWDRAGFSANDTVRIRVLPPADTPDPEMFIDKFVSPGYANIGEPVTVHIFMRGEGFRTAPRYLDVMHVIDVSGSMSPDYMGGRYNDRPHGYTPYRNFEGTVEPFIWNTTFNVTETGADVTYEVLVYTEDDFDAISRWYGYMHKAPMAIRLYVMAPDGSVGNSNGVIFSPLDSSGSSYPDDYVFGKYYTVTNPILGEWTIKVVGMFPDKNANDKIDLKVRVVKHNQTPETGIVYNQDSTMDVHEHYTVRLGDYIPSWSTTRYDVKNLYFTVERNIREESLITITSTSSTYYYRLRIYDPDGALVTYTNYNKVHTVNIPESSIKPGQWRIEIIRNPYEAGLTLNWPPFDIDFDIRKTLEVGSELYPLKGTLIKSLNTTLTPSSRKLTLDLLTECEDLIFRFSKASVNPTYAWIEGVGFNSSHVYDLSTDSFDTRIQNGINAVGEYTIYLVNGFTSDSTYNVVAEIGKLDAAKISAMSFNGIMADNDSVGLVKYSYSADMVQWLTENKDLVNTSIASLYGFGATNIGEGLEEAYNELKTNGSAGRIHAIVLLSDGRANRAGGYCDGTYYSNSEADDYARCWANIAKADNITIYTVALGDNADEQLMRDIATAESYFFEAERADELVNIYQQIATELREKAAQNIVVTDVIPPEVELDENSIEIRLGGDLYSDFNLIETSDGTALQWIIPQMNISDVWHASFKVTSNTAGLIGLNVPDVSNVTYEPYPFDGSINIHYLPNETVLFTTSQRSSMTLS